MATIGTFTRGSDDTYSGAIRTLSLNVKAAQMRPADRSDPKGPDYRIFANGIEFGAAWRKTSRGERPYLSVKLDDPSFPRPLFAALVEADEGYALVWSRSRTAS